MRCTRASDSAHESLPTVSAGEAISSWAARLDRLISLASPPPPTLCRQLADRRASRAKGRQDTLSDDARVGGGGEEETGPVCFYLAAPEDLEAAHSWPLWRTHSLHNTEVWARGPSEEALLLSARRHSTQSHHTRGAPRVALLPWSLGEHVVVAGQARGAADTLVLITIISADAPTAHLVGEESNVLFLEGIETACHGALAAVGGGGGGEEGARGAERRRNVLVRFVAVGGSADEIRAIAALVAASAVCGELGEGVVAVETAAGSWRMRDVLTSEHTALVILPQRDARILRGVALQALHAGVGVVGWAGAPLNETASNCHDALLLPELSRQTLAQVLTALRHAGAAACVRGSGAGGGGQQRACGGGVEVEDEERAEWEEVRALGRRQPGLLYARQQAFFMHVVHRMLRRRASGPPTVVSFWPGPHAAHRRTELFRSDALRRFGFAVRESVFSEHLPHVLRKTGGGGRGG